MLPIKVVFSNINLSGPDTKYTWFPQASHPNTSSNPAR